MPAFGVRRQSRGRREGENTGPEVDRGNLIIERRQQWEAYREAMVARGALDPDGRWIKADNLSREQRQYVLKLQTEYNARVTAEEKVGQAVSTELVENDTAKLSEAEAELGLEVGEVYDLVVDDGREKLTYQGLGEDGKFLFVTQKGKRLLGRMTVDQLLEQGVVDGAKYAYSLDRDQLEDLAA